MVRMWCVAQRAVSKMLDYIDPQAVRLRRCVMDK